MKKIFCVALAACLVFCSAALAFAAPVEIDDYGEAYYGFQNLPVFISHDDKTINAYLTVYAAPGSSITLPYYESEFLETDIDEFVSEIDTDNTYVESVVAGDDSFVVTFSDDVPEVWDDETYYPLTINYPVRAFSGEYADDEEAYYGFSVYVACFDFDFGHNEGSTFGSSEAIVGPSSYDYSSIIGSFSDALDSAAETLTGFDDYPVYEVPSSFGSYPAMSYVPGGSNPGSNPSGPSTVGEVVSTVGDVFSSAVSWIPSVIGVIVDNPLLLIFIIIPLVGLGVGLTKRLLNL